MRYWIDLVETELSPADIFRREAQKLRAEGKLPSKVSLGHKDEHTVEIVSIYSEDRGKGAGTKTMKALCDLADRLGVTLELFPRSAVEYGWDDGDEDWTNALDQEALEGWYYRMGFDGIPNRDPSSSNEWDDYMVRLPHGKPPAWRL